MRQRIFGKVVKTARKIVWIHNQQVASWKWTVEDVDGNRYWGSIPKEILKNNDGHDVHGLVVEFHASIEGESYNEDTKSTYKFYKRPTKFKKIA